MMSSWKPGSADCRSADDVGNNCSMCREMQPPVIMMKSGALSLGTDF